MKTKYIKGMRDIPTVQGIRSRSMPNTQPQAATELARLEHEKARLKRELKIWIDNQERTEKRLRYVEDRLALVKQVLIPLAAEGPTKPLSRGRAKVGRSPTEEGDSREGEAQSWREIPLEY